MPEVVRIENDIWKLSVWTKDAEKPRKRLAATLEARGLDMPAAVVRMSPPAFIPFPASDYLAKTLEHTLPDPVFFENRLYEFDFQFTGDISALAPKIVHWRSDVRDAFHLSGSSLRGSINFGNDIGWFRLGLELSGGRKQSISFEVFPT